MAERGQKKRVQYEVWKERAVTATAAAIFLFLFLGAASTAFFVVEERMLFGGRVIVDVSEGTFEEIVFPVSVDPVREVIVESPEVEEYFEEHVVGDGGTARHVSWIGKAIGKLALMDWYQNLASASSRLLVILPGERREEVGAHFAKILGWSVDEREEFIRTIAAAEPMLAEGKYAPGRYTVVKGAGPEEVAELVLTRFSEEVLTRYTPATDAIVPIEDALTIASLLEREAYDFEDMRLIAGVIWNRLFIDMNLQIDATLQYAKGSKPTEAWWPKVLPRDKYIESPYNTYENTGLPPTPIASPSLEAILAALNPKKTDCLYYFHDRNAGFHCTPTYEEHVALLKEYYGRGK